MNLPNVRESRVTLDRFKACTVMGTVDDKPDASVDAGSNSGTTASSSHSFSCSEDAGLTTVLSALLPTTIRRKVVSDRNRLKWTLTTIEVPAEPPRRGYPKVRNIRSRDVMKSRDVERGVFEGAVHPETCKQGFLEEHSALQEKDVLEARNDLTYIAGELKYA